MNNLKETKLRKFQGKQLVLADYPSLNNVGNTNSQQGNIASWDGKIYYSVGNTVYCIEDEAIKDYIEKIESKNVNKPNRKSIIPIPVQALADFLELDDASVISTLNWEDFDLIWTDYQEYLYQVGDSIYLVQNIIDVVDAFWYYLKDIAEYETILDFVDKDCYVEEMKQHFSEHIKSLNIKDAKEENNLFESLISSWKNSFEWKTDGMSEQKKYEFIFENNLFDKGLVSDYLPEYMISESLCMIDDYLFDSKKEDDYKVHRNLEPEANWGYVIYKMCSKA